MTAESVCGWEWGGVGVAGCTWLLIFCIMQQTTARLEALMAIKNGSITTALS